MEAPLSDEHLMLRYRNGDAEAFEALYTRHKKGLYRFILRQCRHTATAEELFQDVWMGLINSRRRYEVKARFKTYLYQMASNRVIDFYRRQHTRATGTESELAMAFSEISDEASPQPAAVAEATQVAQRLLQLLDRLPEQQKQAFLLRAEAGMTVAESAEVMAVSVETAKSRLRYAVKKLKDGIGDPA